jgi:hypothetical protein
MESRAAAVRATERWMIKRGIPHFIEDYSATRDIFTRAAPLLSFLFLMGVFSAINFESWWANTLAVFGAFVLLVGAWALINHSRGRTWFERPTSIGPVELTAFVLIPPLVPGVFGGDFDGSLELIAINLSVLALIYVVTSYGVIPIAVWATRRLFRSLGGTVLLFARAIPLLLLFVTFLFINAEVWQISANLDGPLFAATLGLFGAIGATFVVVRLPSEVAGLGRFDSWDRVHEACNGTPAAELARSGSQTPPERKLTRAQWGNVGLMVLFGQMLQVLLVGVLVFAFLILLGLLVMPESVIAAWTQLPVRLIGPELQLLGREVRISEELLRVSSFLASFSALYFAVTAVTDSSYRDEFFEDVVGEVRQTFAVRAAYLDALDLR